MALNDSDFCNNGVHDRIGGSDGIAEPIPGALIGGPNNGNTYNCNDSTYVSLLPALSYMDMECSYATNEIAINWNAALVLLNGAVNAITAK